MCFTRVRVIIDRSSPCFVTTRPVYANSRQRRRTSRSSRCVTGYVVDSASPRRHRLIIAIRAFAVIVGENLSSLGEATHRRFFSHVYVRRLTFSLGRVASHCVADKCTYSYVSARYTHVSPLHNRCVFSARHATEHADTCSPSSWCVIHANPKGKRRYRGRKRLRRRSPRLMRYRLSFSTALSKTKHRMTLAVLSWWTPGVSRRMREFVSRDESYEWIVHESIVTFLSVFLTDGEMRLDATTDSLAPEISTSDEVLSFFTLQWILRRTAF